MRWLGFVGSQSRTMMLVGSAGVGIWVSGCGMNAPSLQTPSFSMLGFGDASVPAPTDHSQQDGVYVAPKVEYYCRGPNFDPEAPCLAPKTAKRQKSPKSGVILVAKGDTLFSLAHRHNTSAEALSDLNGLEGTDIYPGQELELPAPLKR